MLLAPHDPNWANEFASLREVYLNALGRSVMRIEHVGSTAVPLLMAKPILDIDIVMPGYEEFPRIVQELRKLGYSHNGDQGIKEREAFKQFDHTVPFTTPPRQWLAHHLYVCPVHSVELRRHILFRDLLRADENLRGEYERRKLSIARRAGQDRKAYAQIKEAECGEFIEKALGLAGSGRK